MTHYLADCQFMDNVENLFSVCLSTGEDGGGEVEITNVYNVYSIVSIVRYGFKQKMCDGMSCCSRTNHLFSWSNKVISIPFMFYTSE